MWGNAILVHWAKTINSLTRYCGFVNFKDTLNLFDEFQNVN